MAGRIHTTTSCISVIYYIFCAITLNISTLIRVRCKEPMFERVSVTKLKLISIEEGAKKYVTFTCNCSMYHPQKNTRMYGQQLTHSFSEYDTLYQNECHYKKILKFVRLAPHTFPLVSWFKSTHTAHGIMVGYTPSLPCGCTYQSETEMARMLLFKR